MSESTHAALARLVEAVFRLDDEWGCHEGHKERLRRDMLVAARAAKAALGAADAPLSSPSGVNPAKALDVVLTATNEADRPLLSCECVVCESHRTAGCERCGHVPGSPMTEPDRGRDVLERLVIMANDQTKRVEARLAACEAEQARCATLCRCGCHA